ncbi:hypothetical protein JCM10295v2_000648 [Rhodotorula toruloides]
MPLHSREAAETLAVSLYAQAAADFEREAGPVERRVFEEGAAWCRGRWADEQRTKLAMTSALNKLTARSFRERGRRREMVQDLVDDLEKLFLQAKIVEDDDRRRAFLGCFLEFPGLVKRLTAKDSFVSAIEEALVWEGEMVLKERRVRTESLTAILRAAWTPGGLPEGFALGESGEDAGDAADRLAKDPDLRRSPAHCAAPPLNNSPFPYATPKSAFSSTHTRSNSASPMLAPETPSPATRISTPPFVAEATSTPLRSTSMFMHQPTNPNCRAEDADFNRFADSPNPARPWPPSTNSTGQASGLIGYLRRAVGGHRRSKSYGGGPIGVASSGEGGVGNMQASEGRPAKQRGRMMPGGLGLPP